MRLINTLVSTAIVALLSSSAAQAATARDAQVLKAGLQHAKSVVDRAISAAGGSGSIGGGSSPSFPSGGGQPSGNPGFPSGGHGGFLVDDDSVIEADALAVPVLTQASGNLFDAGHFVDVSNIDLLNGNIQQGNFEFAQACSRMGISRSQIARANMAALQPPVGFLAAFSNEFLNVVQELNALRFQANCP